MNNKPLVSIILPVHNSAKFLPECLQSLVKQTYKNIEIVTIDDSSVDNSYGILKEFSKKYSPRSGEAGSPRFAGEAGKKVRVYRNIKRYGIGVTLNRLAKKAKGDLIAFMDSHDISHIQRIKKQVKFLLENPEVVAVGNQCRFIDDNNKYLGKSKFPKENRFIYESPLHGISMQFETVLINKTLLPKDILKFDTNSNPFVYSDIFMKLLPYGKFANLNEYLHYHRNDPKAYFFDLRIHLISLIKLWIKSIANYNYQLSVKSFFTPLIKQS